MSLWQHKLLRETSFYICVEQGKIHNTSLFSPAASEKDKKRLTLAAYVLRLQTPGLPVCDPLSTSHGGGDRQPSCSWH